MNQRQRNFFSAPLHVVLSIKSFYYISSLYKLSTDFFYYDKLNQQHMSLFFLLKTLFKNTYIFCLDKLKLLNDFISTAKQFDNLI